MMSRTSDGLADIAFASIRPAGLFDVPMDGLYPPRQPARAPAVSPARKRKLDPERVVAMWNSGDYRSVSSLAVALKVTPFSVNKLLRKAGALTGKLSKGSGPRFDHDAAEKLWRSGKFRTLDELAAHLGVTRPGLARVLRVRGAI